LKVELAKEKKDFMKFKYHIGQIEKDYKERDEERLKLAT
jgi:hypothetical protein